MSRSLDGPRSLGETLRHLTNRYRRVDFFVIDEIKTRWSEIVGERLAASCVPTMVRDGALIVSVPSGAFSERLKMQERTILDQLADLGDAAPTSLQFHVENRPPRGR